ncbi:prolyl-tRNA synthetase associated domain-containing protein [Mammaliicoccus sciuri]|uniref:prolyl-tRNA synthetase associated domain-containing protein n=1 Tax=Mammaliicoccus sciuri TaxID=1296 RepID=UPI001FB4ACFF|nr:prolyl-tRNA synthetase associated domain-containing protein [Mammaliicoccus sciuri]MCJ0952502.1 prolyl-tRNA synthetase associated domain-containing protein [Mammaliicoccus sciuri]
MDKDKKVYYTLEQLDIDYTVQQHEAVFTSEDVKAITPAIKGMHCKNLFLRNKKGDVHYLAVLPDTKNLNLKELSKTIDSTNLSFASPGRLNKYLKVEPGSVSIFSLINDDDTNVKLIIDRDILECNVINFHPNINTATISLPIDGFYKYIKTLNNDITYIS